MQAARDGRVDVIKEWLQFYENSRKRGERKQNPIDVKDSEGLAALHYAARFNKFEILAYLLTENPGLF